MRWNKLFTMCDSLICCLCRCNEVVLVVPDDELLCIDLLTMHHASPLAGYPGLNRMTHALAKHYW